jgi:DNA-binding response OmpR family regulator
MIIDRTRKKVSIDNREIVLTPKEYQILVLLFENRGRIFSKEDIFNKIWNEDSFGDINTISVHIRRIREKLEKDPSNPEYIETIWGVGYRGN